MIIQTFTAGLYRAEVNHDFTVNLFRDDELIDWPGPWGDAEGALKWASEIVAVKDAEEQ
jgi:hypothetical protein